MTKDCIEETKRRYPKGIAIEVIQMGEDEPRPIPPKSRGTVIHVDDIGTVHCQFENGRQLGLIPGIDCFRIPK